MESVAQRELVLCCGMIRSASTLQYQVVSELLERNARGQRVGFADSECVTDILGKVEAVSGSAVVKVHEFLPEFESAIAQGRARLFYTFRDLRAVAVSAMRKWGLPFTQIIARRGWLEIAVESSLRWLSAPRVCLSRYEDIVLALPAEVMKWAAALDIDMTSSQAERWGAAFCIEAQRERTTKIPLHAPDEIGRFGAYFEPESLLYRNHIRDGSLDRWKIELEKWQIRQIEARFSQWLLDRGYFLYGS
jgi:hypothetical protein